MDCNIKPIRKTQKLDEEIISIFLEAAKERLGEDKGVDFSKITLEADVGGAPVGWAEYMIICGLIYLSTLVVRKEYRKSGIGSQLLNRVMQIGVENRCESMYLETASFQAPDFYKKFGFKVDFVRSGFLDGHCVYYMSKKL